MDQEEKKGEPQPPEHNILRALIEGTTDAVFVKDVEGRYKLVNSTLARFIGRPINQIIGKRDSDLYPPDTARQFVEADRRVLESGETHVFEGIASGEGGGTQVYRVTKGVIRDEQGAVIGVFGISHDMTDRLRAEEERLQRMREQVARAEAEASGHAKDELLRALKASEERYRSLLENANDIVYSHDLAGNYLSINRAGERITGYTREEVLEGMNIAQMVAPEHLELARGMTARKLGDPSPTVYEVDVIAKDGRRLTLEVSTRIAERDGLPPEIEGIARDVTERKRAEAALRATEKRFTMFMENLPGLAWIKDLEGRYVYANDSAMKAFGKPPSELYGKRDDDVFPPETAAQFKENDLRALECGTGIQAIETLVQDDGTHHSIVSKFPLLGANGEAVMVGGVAFDITERKLAEKEREELLVREQAARLKAEEASRLKDEFLATLSHELRTPLTAILGWAHLLNEETLDDEMRTRALRAIERNARAQQQLISDILDVSRSITGNLRLEIQPLELTTLINAALDAVRPAAELKSISLKVELDPEANHILGDQTRLQQVLWNLLSNAIKFTPREGRVGLAVIREESSVRIKVSDTGQGIMPDFLPHVFERFRQADQTTTREQGGLGLGLAIVRHLVEQHGGNVYAESGGAGQGSTFAIELPVSPANMKPEGAKLSSQSKEQSHVREASGGLRGLRVLIVDDQEDAREYLSTALGQHGAQVITAASAPEALRLLRSERPHVLISDIGMPGEDGYTLIREIRNLSEHHESALPAIALTGYAGDSDRDRALSSGFQLHMTKPFELMELVSAIAKLGRP